MLSLKECSDFCSLGEDEMRAIERGAHVSAVEACALAHEAEDSPKDSRRMLRYLQEYLEYVEGHESAQRSREVHHIIEHFTNNHRMI